MSPVKRLGLTGGIAAGKSEVAQLFRAKGIPVIDMDLLSRQLLDSDKSLQNEVLSAMGHEIMTQGKIDRSKLRELVFSHPEKKKVLEALIHPKVRQEFERLAEKENAGGNSLVLCEAALLIESGYRNQLDGLVVVIAPEEVRRSRLKNRPGLTDALVDQIFNSQVKDGERLAAATYVINNDSHRDTLAPQVEALIAIWKQQGLI